MNNPHRLLIDYALVAVCSWCCMRMSILLHSIRKLFTITGHGREE